MMQLAAELDKQHMAVRWELLAAELQLFVGLLYVLLEAGKGRGPLMLMLVRLRCGVFGVKAIFGRFAPALGKRTICLQEPGMRTLFDC